MVQQEVTLLEMMQRQETQSNKVIGIAFTKSHTFYKSTAQEILQHS
jgi:hypothetical protein